MFFGNTFVYFQFQGKNHIDKDTRQLVFGVLIAGAVVGVGFLLSLRRVRLECSPIDSELEVEQDASSNSSVFEAFRNAVRLFTTRDMLLLSLMFLYTGLELSFFSGVYSPSIGFTLQLGEGAKQLVGMSGILIGVGEVSGGVLFGLMGSKTTKYGRTPIVVVGFIIHIVAFFLIYLNLPNDAPFGDTKEFSFFKPPQPSVALLCSLFLGFGDACFNTQIYSMLGSVYAKNSAAAFALFKFTQVIYTFFCQRLSSATINIYNKLSSILVGSSCFWLCVFVTSGTTVANEHSTVGWCHRNNGLCASGNGCETAQ